MSPIAVRRIQSGMALSESGQISRLSVIASLNRQARCDKPASLRVSSTRKRRHIWPNRQATRAKWSKKEIFAAWDSRVLDLYLAEGLSDRADGQVELKCPGVIEAAIFESAHSIDMGSLAKNARVPTLILWATGGDFPRIVYENLARDMLDARILDVDTGHLIPMERPDYVVDAALDFAAQREIA